MYCFEQDNHEKAIIRRKVDFDEDTIRNIREDVIEDCSNIVHRQVRARRGEIQADGKRIRDVEEFTVDYTNSYEANVDMCNVTYIEYVFPELVSWIDKLLEGDPTSINHLIGNEAKEETVSYDAKIIEANAKVDSIDNFDYTAKVEALTELKRIIEDSELNKGGKSTKPYLDRLKVAITVTTCATLPLETLDRVQTFFGMSLEEFGLDKIILKDSSKKDEKTLQMKGDLK